MTTPYLLPGLQVAEMRGMKELFGQVLAELRKGTPSHISIVGPRYFGKSVLIHSLALALAAESRAERIVCSWDLRHDTPVDDSDFVCHLSRKLDGALLAQGIDSYHEYLVSPSASFSEASDNLKLVIESLDAAGTRLVVLLDDFDRLGQQSSTTVNLWNYLRGLAQYRNLRFVITSRRRLRDVIAGKESRASDFWNVFGAPFVLRPHPSSDLDSWLQPLEGADIRLNAEARSELMAWTGGLPVLLAAFLSQLSELGTPKRVSKSDVETIAGIVADKARDLIQDLWDDCSPEQQRDLCEVARQPSLLSELPLSRLGFLLDRGYAMSVAGPALACRLMQRFAAENDAAAAELTGWLRDPASELRLLKQMLALKLSKIQGGDPDLRHDISIAISSIELGKKSPLRSFRSIAEQSVALAWDAEFPDGRVPQSTQIALTAGQNAQAHSMQRDLAAQTELNSRRNILRRAVGGYPGASKLTKKLTRPAMLLIDHLHQLGNYGQHLKQFSDDIERPVDDLFCAYACLSSVLLFERLSGDLLGE